MTEPLPQPTRARWQPLRLGLLDLFYYDDEQFWFHDGRLLLRGNNGTGKSKVLALTLPFLLDGSVSPRRVEPDADAKKRMDWNLLLGGAHPQSERTGYSWIEFGRVDADGAEHFVTLGIGMKAASGRGLVKTWYFVSDRRIGELRLMDDERVVLTQERLRDELAATAAGQVFTTQESYRRAVDEELFGLGEERYAALVDLLIQLRQPQLSRQFDERALSTALTESLAPLDQAIIADAAESFRSLEEEREGIAQARDTLAATEGFLDHYRAYAEVAARRHTTSVRLANSDYEQAGRSLREAEEALAAAEAEVAGLSEGQATAQEHLDALHGRDRALRESPEMRDAGRIEDAAAQAAAAHARVEAATAEAEEAGSRADREAEARRKAVSRHEAAAAEAERLGSQAAGRARAAGLGSEHPSTLADADAARRLVERRREQIRHIRRLAKEAEEAGQRADQRRTALDSAESGVSARTEDSEHAQAAVEAAVAGYAESVRAYTAGLGADDTAVLDLGSTPEELGELAETWARGHEGDSPVRAAVDRAFDRAGARIGRDRAEAEHAADLLETERRSVLEEIAALEAGRDPEPEAHPARDRGARVEAAGAPLWRLIDFAEALPADRRAGIEAALQSAGLLDAWLFPDGELRADGDVVLGPSGGAASVSAAAVLVPAVGPDAPVSGEVVAAVLDRIGLGEASGAAVWVDEDGRWGAGPVHGSWTKGDAAFIGAGAREVHRRELLATLRDRVAGLTRSHDEARARIDVAVAGLERLRTRRDAYPAAAERGLVTAHAEAAAALRELERARAAAAEAQRRWREADERAGLAATELAGQAGELRVGTSPEQIEEALEALSSYEQALTEARAAGRALAEAAAALAGAEARAAEAELLRQRRGDELQAQRSQAATAQATLEALRESVGASVDELLQQLDLLGEEQRQLQARLTRIAKERLAAAEQRGVQEQRVRDLGRQREQSASARNDATERLRAFAATGLLRVALAELSAPDPERTEEWHVTAALALSRAAEQLLGDTDDSDPAWSRAQQRVSNAATELSSQMSRHGHTSFVEQRGDVLIARVRYLDEEIDIDRLADRLAADLVDRERLLSAREREILENHLVNDVAAHLHELLSTAEAQIDRMNRELAERKTSTGMQLRVIWRERSDGPAGLSAARRLLGRSDASWAADDRSAIGDFLQERIAEVRLADPTGGWQEHLQEALDYRGWHRFAVERWQNGQWRSASGPSSTGEKVLSVSIPLFAAASAHYNSAGPNAPRLILLDEAFAGVDDDSRAKSLGLLATFDLDVAMTSEREWGCYPQVPGLAIAQLSRVEGIDAVGVTRWRWDGRRRQRTGEVAASARAGETTPEQADDDATTLFD